MGESTRLENENRAGGRMALPCHNAAVPLSEGAQKEALQGPRVPGPMPSDPLALSCLLSSPAPSVGGGLCHEDWLMGAQVPPGNRCQANPAGRQGVDHLLGVPGPGTSREEGMVPGVGGHGAGPQSYPLLF